MIGQTFIHKPTKERYIVTHTGTLKFKGTWFSSVSYVSENSNSRGFYTRTFIDFNKEFEQVTNCEQDDVK